MNERIYAPSHYDNKRNIDAVDVADAWGLNRYLFSTVKYIQRNGKKADTCRFDDLVKGIWYMVYEATGSRACADRVCNIVQEVGADAPSE